MRTGTKIRHDATDYRVIALQPELGRAANELEVVLPLGLRFEPDQKRPGFFTIRLDGRGYYIHVYEPGKTVYLLGIGPDEDRVPADAFAMDHAMACCPSA